MSKAGIRAGMIARINSPGLEAGVPRRCVHGDVGTIVSRDNDIVLVLLPDETIVKVQVSEVDLDLAGG